ncbi:Chaperone DnaJ-domain superfamily protein, putative isoform 1 [Hibiscus syriacus]|uniref:Chaperone DnaJ-domain superfamily protein, putative isoform 1 n=1 Tax=Hibiscus syriacus TaxID=106335 RepID=A0A6A3ABL4_HIBSY|nr:Chaperone DnaJ-domain superfamily protein, putative isoform 1 [Hibiscus syriacus]
MLSGSRSSLSLPSRTVSDELKKIKHSSISDSLKKGSNYVSETSDELWEYNGLQDAYQGECEEMLLEMQRIFYEDLRRETEGKEPIEGIEAWEDEEDEYLARAGYNHMQLNNELVQ